MAKKIAGTMKLQVPAGQANPSPPVGPALGQRGINIMEFCKAFNAKTQDHGAGRTLPDDHHLLSGQVLCDGHQDAAGVLFPEKGRQAEVGCEQPQSRETVGTVTTKQVREIAEAKMADLSANDVDQPQ